VLGSGWSRSEGAIVGSSGLVQVGAGATLFANGGIQNIAAVEVEGQLNVMANSNVTGLITSTAGTGGLNVASGTTLTAGGFHGLEAVTLGTGARLTTGETNNRTKALALDTDATLDLTTGNLIVDYDTTNPYDTIEALITTAIANPNSRPWDGPGITSSAASATLYALGVLDNANAPTFVTPFNDTTRLFEGEGVDDTSVLVKYTYYGDCNLDGAVTPVDVQRLIMSWNGATEGDPRWAVGDFNYDGTISPTDVQLLIFGWNQQGGPLAAGVPVCAAPSATPEPATLLLLAGGAAAALARRRQ